MTTTARRRTSRFRDGLWLAGQAWLTILGPALVGGPWRFYSFPNQWSAYADPPVVLLVIGQVALVAPDSPERAADRLARAGRLVHPRMDRGGRPGARGIGRWVVARRADPTALRYSYYVPVALALGIVLAFGAKPSTSRHSSRAVGTRFDKRRRGALVGGDGRLAPVSSAFSTMRFADRFWENPAKDYSTALLSNTAERGPTVAAARHAAAGGRGPLHLGDVRLRPARPGGCSADFGGQSSNRLVVNEFGGLVPARFVKVADFEGPPQPGCGIHVHGSGTTRIPLEP